MDRKLAHASRRQYLLYKLFVCIIMHYYLHNRTLKKILLLLSFHFTSSSSHMRLYGACFLGLKLTILHHEHSSVLHSEELQSFSLAMRFRSGRLQKE